MRNVFKGIIGYLVLSLMVMGGAAAYASSSSGTSPFALLGIANIWTIGQTFNGNDTFSGTETHSGAETFSNSGTNFSNGLKSGGITVPTTANVRWRVLPLSSGTYTPNTTYVHDFYVFVNGSTGAFNNVGSGAKTGGQGGAGYSEKHYASPSGSYSYTVGQGGASGTSNAGGSTTFDVITVTGGAGGNASAGGAGSGGDFNATGGTGGAAGSNNGGGGGGAGRAGNGGNGGSGAGANGGGGGGTGGNNASTITGGAAGSLSGSALTIPFALFDTQSFQAGLNGTGVPGMQGANGYVTTGLQNFPSLGGAGGNYGNGATGGYTFAGSAGSIVILEVLK